MRHITKWNETFETADSRKRQRLGWLQIPTGNDSTGYIELMSHGHRGAMAFGVFLAICQWSATQRQETRGKLARSDGRPVTDRQLAAIIRIPTDVVADSIALLSSPEVNWIHEEAQQNASSAGNMPVPCHSSATHLPESATHLPALCKEKEKEKEKEKDRTPVADATPVVVGTKNEAAPLNYIMQQFVAAFGGTVRATEGRKKAANTRWRDRWWREHWEEALERGSASPFLRGETSDRGWRMSMDFFLKPDTVAKILEGTYDESEAPRRQRLTPTQQREQNTADSFAIFERAHAELVASSDQSGEVHNGTKKIGFIKTGT